MYFAMLHLPSKCSPFLNEIFKYYDEFLDIQLTALACKCREAEGANVIHASLYINGSVYRITHLKESTNYCYDFSIGFLHPSLQEEGDKFVECVDKCNRDMRFINQWLSIAINSLDTEGTRKRLPNFIAKLHARYAYSPSQFCEVPEGKEEMWEKAQALVKYYMGYKLLV